MAHYAKLGLNSEVLLVIVLDNKELKDEKGNEIEQKGIDFLEKLTGYSYWVQTSYSRSFRKNYAGVGFRYDKELDVFIEPKPFPSWSLDIDFRWQAPVPYPTDGKEYMWDEELQNWSILAEL